MCADKCKTVARFALKVGSEYSEMYTKCYVASQIQLRQQAVNLHPRQHVAVESRVLKQPLTDFPVKVSTLSRWADYKPGKGL